MIQTTYTVIIEVSQSPDQAFIQALHLSQWWPEQFEGPPLQLGSEFILRTGEGHFSRNKVLVLEESRKLVWITMESLRAADQFDWSGTKMIFEFSPKNDQTIIKFTYEGVVLENEQERLSAICNFCIQHLLYNYIESLRITLEISKPCQVVFDSLSEVTSWWSKDFEGQSKYCNDEFTIHHPGQHYSRQKLTEVIPFQKLVWMVLESELYWLQNNRNEWTGTQLIFELTPMRDKTILQFTHLGLTPNLECYTMCLKGWTMVITKWLPHFILHGRESPEMTKIADIRHQMLSENNQLN